MTCFFKMDSVWQIFLLILSQFTVFSLVIGIVFLYSRGCKFIKMLSLVLIFLLNTILYVIIQLDSRITGAKQAIHLHVPYIILLFLVVISLSYNVWILIKATKRRKTINRNSIKESFDNLPTGVCFFNASGIPVLCNLAIQRFSFAVCGKDIQFINDLENCLADNFVPMNDIKKEGRTFIFPDGKVWKLKKRNIIHKCGNTYTQYIASDITHLYNSREELIKENEQLRKVQADLQQLSANVVTVTREEEILNTKMRVHDEMGRCLIAAQQYLTIGNTDSIPNSIATSWQRAVSMIKYSNDTPDEDMMLQIRKTCEFVKLDFIQTGEPVKSEKIAYILICAVRECVTNAVRYAKATELYADFSETKDEATVILTNNGKKPDGKITEGGGLSSLRHRVERAGGQMIVQSFPEFKLIVTVPKVKESIT